MLEIAAIEDAVYRARNARAWRGYCRLLGPLLSVELEFQWRRATRALKQAAQDEATAN